MTISRGELSKIIGKVSAALEEPYEELLALLPSEAVVNVDETGHKDNGNKWCAAVSAWFKDQPAPSLLAAEDA